MEFQALTLAIEIFAKDYSRFTVEIWDADDKKLNPPAILDRRTAAVRTKEDYR